MEEENPVSRGCFFCKSGKEEDVVLRFGLIFPEGRAIIPTRTRIRRKKDVAIEEKVSLLPGYVFFELNAPYKQGSIAEQRSKKEILKIDNIESELQLFTHVTSVLKLLRYSDGDWRLQGADDLFAKMLFEIDGNIGISQVYFDKGNRIRILNGFLKNYEGSITRVNKKTKTVEIETDFQGKKISMWLGYEQISAIDQ